MTTCSKRRWLRREFFDDFPAHLIAAAAARLYRRLDYFGDNFSARVQHFGLSLFAGFRTVGAVALSFLCRRQSGAHVFAGFDREYCVHDLIVIARKIGQVGDFGGH